MKVLDRVGVAAELVRGPPSTPATLRWDEFTSSGKYLGGPGCELLEQFSDKYGWPCVGVTRTRLQTLLMDKCRESGITIHTGWRLAELEELDDGILARSYDGRKVHADFVIGADALKSRTREVLLAKRGIPIEAPDFTGVVVLGGASPTPESLRDTAAIRVWLGATMSVISHTLEDNMSVWGLLYDQTTAVKESWRTVPKEELAQEIVTTLGRVEGWAKPVRDLIAGTTKMMSIGLYDRPELPVEQWYSGRGVLIGDAAHPTT